MLSGSQQHLGAFLTRSLGGAAHDALGELVPARRDGEAVVDDKGAATPRRLVRPRMRDDSVDAVTRCLERVLNEIDKLRLGGRGAAGKRRLGLNQPVSERVDSPARPGIALLEGKPQLERLVKSRASRSVGGKVTSRPTG